MQPESKRQLHLRWYRGCQTKVPLEEFERGTFEALRGSFGNEIDTRGILYGNRRRSTGISPRRRDNDEEHKEAWDELAKKMSDLNHPGNCACAWSLDV